MYQYAIIKPVGVESNPADGITSVPISAVHVHAYNVLFLIHLGCVVSPLSCAEHGCYCMSEGELEKQRNVTFELEKHENISVNWRNTNIHPDN